MAQAAWIIPCRQALGLTCEPLVGRVLFPYFPQLLIHPLFLLLLGGAVPDVLYVGLPGTSVGSSVSGSGHPSSVGNRQPLTGQLSAEGPQDAHLETPDIAGLGHRELPGTRPAPGPAAMATLSL